MADTAITPPNAPRRRLRDRPVMVPLEEFGKPPPPPPRNPISVRSALTLTAIVLGVIILFVWVSETVKPQYDAVWGNVAKLDQRTNR